MAKTQIKCPQCQTYFVKIINPSTGKQYYLCRCEKKTENFVHEEVKIRPPLKFAEGL